MGEVSVKLENYIIAFGTLMSNMPYPPKYIYFSEVDNGDFVVYSPEYGTLQTFGDSVQLNPLQHAEVVSAFKTYERKVIEEEARFKAYERECMETGKRMVSPTTVDLATYKAHLYRVREEDGVPDHDRSITESVDSPITVNTGKRVAPSTAIDLTESADSPITLNTRKRTMPPSKSNHPRSTHVKRRKKKFICVVCGKGYSRKDNLNRHFDTVQHSD